MMKPLALSLLAVAFSAAATSAVEAHATRSDADQALYEAAKRECNSYKYMPNGASIHINYKKGWFRCEDRHDRKRDKRRGKR